MPELTTFLLFAVTTIALVAIPGPNALYIAARSVAHGRQAGFASALGVEAGSLVHVGAATIGVSALIASSAAAFATLKWLGVAYLCYLGIRTLARRGGESEQAEVAPARLGRAFAEGALVNILNPKVALFFLAFLPQFVDPSRGGTATQTLALGVVFLAIGLCLDLLLVLVAGTMGARVRGHRRERHVTGTIYLLLGGAAALAGGRH